MALTSDVTQAAPARPYSVSTLRNYIRTWEEIYGALPRSRRDNAVQLVGPLLDIFDSAYEVGVGRQSAIKDRIAEALRDETTALPRVVTAYSTVLGCEDLAGVEHTISRLQAHCLADLAAKIQEVTKRTSDALQLDKRIDKEFSDLYDNLATIFDRELEFVKESANAFNSYLETLEFYRRVSHEVAQAYLEP